MDQVIAIIILVAVSAVATLLKKLKQGEEPQNTPPLNRPRQSRPSPAPQRPTTSWEDELRRLLGDENAPPPPAPRPPPAPVITPAPPPTIAPTIPAPSPVVRAPSPIRSQTRPEPRRQPQPMAAPRPRAIITPTARPAPEPLPMQVEVVEAAMLTPAQPVYQQAAQLSQETSARMGRVVVGPIRSRIVEARAPSAEVAQVVGLFKNARSARQAVIASIILSPPPSLEPSSQYF